MSNPNTTPKRTHGGKATGEAILKSAGRQFAKHGYGSTSIRDISADSGTSPGLVMYHWKSKKNLFMETIRYHVFENTRFGEVFNPLLSVPLDQPQVISDTLQDLTYTLLQLCHGRGKSRYLNGLLICLFVDAEPDLHVRFMQQVEKVQTNVRQILRQIRPDFDEFNVSAWLRLFWSQIFHTITVKPLILVELNTKNYTDEWIFRTAWQIAWYCASPLGLPAPTKRPLPESMTQAPIPDEDSSDHIDPAAPDEDPS